VDRRLAREHCLQLSIPSEEHTHNFRAEISHGFGHGTCASNSSNLVNFWPHTGQLQTASWGAGPAECRPPWPSKRIHCWSGATKTGHCNCSFAISDTLPASYLKVYQKSPGGYTAGMEEAHHDQIATFDPAAEDL